MDQNKTRFRKNQIINSTFLAIVASFLSNTALISVQFGKYYHLKAMVIVIVFFVADFLTPGEKNWYKSRVITTSAVVMLVLDVLIFVLFASF